LGSDSLDNRRGGQVQMPLGKTFWSPRFGMVADRFGVGWMVSVAP
jgi:PhnB protein